jgi:hypothetical protein
MVVCELFVTYNISFAVYKIGTYEKVLSIRNNTSYDGSLAICIVFKHV